MNKLCQSCGMPLIDKQIDRRGTEDDGIRSETYCNLCYLQGKFTNPMLTKEEVIRLGLEAVEKEKMNKIKKWLIKKSYPAMVNNLARWK